MSRADVLDAIVGEQLSSVEFVQNYVQLRFDGPTLTIYDYPVVEIGGIQYTIDSPGYRDRLCERIATLVRSAAADGEAIRVGFADGARVVVPLRPERDVGPEAAMFDNPLNGKWMVWQYDAE